MVEPMNKSKKDQQVMDERIKAVSDPIAAALNTNLANLTTAINKASTSSTLVGLGLILTGLAAWCLFFLEIGKMCFGPDRPFETSAFAVAGGVLGANNPVGVQEESGALGTTTGILVRKRTLSTPSFFEFVRTLSTVKTFPGRSKLFERSTSFPQSQRRNLSQLGGKFLSFSPLSSARAYWTA